MTGDQSGTDEIFMAAQEAVGAATGQQRDSQGRHEWLTRFIIIMVFTMALVQISLNYWYQYFEMKPLDITMYFLFRGKIEYCVFYWKVKYKI